VSEHYRVWLRPGGLPRGTLDGCRLLEEITVPDDTDLAQLSRDMIAKYPEGPGEELLFEAMPYD
jgi:hypothetical protein